MVLSVFSFHLFFFIKLFAIMFSNDYNTFQNNGANEYARKIHNQTLYILLNHFLPNYLPCQFLSNIHPKGFRVLPDTSFPAHRIHGFPFSPFPFPNNTGKLRTNGCMYDGRIPFRALWKICRIPLPKQRLRDSPGYCIR